ncbi:MAG: hypothetical protein SGI73_21320 [Chloroflexota bacterium]|nr:hypothetical protein [Chloroflexota bacterium]
MIDVPALPTIALHARSPGEQRAESAARCLRWGAAISAFGALILIGLSALGSFGVVAGVYNGVRGAFLFRSTAPGDTAAAVAILLALLNAGALLVVMIGAQARERWTLPALMIAIAANVVGLIGLGNTLGIVPIAFSAFAFLRVWGGTSGGSPLRANPVMVKELRGRMRGVRAFAVLTVYLLLMSGFAGLLYLIFNSFTRGVGSAAAGEIGRVLFMGIVGVELLLIIFIAPAFTAGAVTGERERQTYDLLRTTLLSSPAFIVGKLESALGFIVLLLLSAIPLQSLAFLFGGVSEIEIILSFVLLLVTAVTLGAVGMYFSVVLPRTLTASVRAYGTIVSAMFIAPILAGVVLSLARDLLVRGGTIQSPVVEALLTYANALITALNPITAALATQTLLIERQVIGIWTLTLASDGSTIPIASPWMLFTVIYIIVSALLIALAIRRARRVEG